MVVAVRTVLVVQVTVHDVIDVFAVRNRGVATTRAVTMRARMGSALVPLRACVGVLLAYGDCVLFEVLSPTVVQVAIVQKVAMAVMLDHRMSAAVLMLVLMLLVNAVRGHGFSFLLS